jgi:hypothetical protein
MEPSTRSYKGILRPRPRQLDAEIKRLKAEQNAPGVGGALSYQSHAVESLEKLGVSRDALLLAIVKQMARGFRPIKAITHLYQLPVFEQALIELDGAYNFPQSQVIDETPKKGGGLCARALVALKWLFPKRLE